MPERPTTGQPTAPSLRSAVERRSRPVLAWLTQRPSWLLPLTSVLLLLGGLLAPPAAGMPLLFALAALLGWLTYLSWPKVAGGGRLMRVAVVAGLLALALSRLA